MIPEPAPTWAAALPQEADTAALGQRAAAALPQLPRAFVVWLSGDLGAGKTAFARFLLRALGEAGPVRSPSYGLVAEYAPPGWRVLHLDLYRLDEPAELLQLGLRDEDRPGCLWLIEWPERAGDLAPRADAQLRFAVGAAGHAVSATAATPEGERWLDLVLPAKAK